MKKIEKLLVANRSEISIRVLRAADELGIRTVAIYAHEDRFALHRFKADESYLVGKGKKPIAAYLDIDDVLRIARESGVDAIHPGYGFLAENPDFAQQCADAGITFIGPGPEVMRTLGNKVSAREAASAAGVPVMPATAALPADLDEVRRLAMEIGYPLMLKASWGGGGRGMRAIYSEEDLIRQLDVARGEARAAFGNDEVYLEKLVQRARHVEVQVMGDTHDNIVHLFERDCSVQRRNQKVVERAPAPYLDAATRQALCDAATRLARQVGYVNAGTVEFLMDADTGKFYFIEVNPRIQVEHTVTEEVTGVDIVKAQILIAQGGRIGVLDGEQASGVPAQEHLRLHGNALQCRVTTEDPEQDFAPDHGTLIAYRSAAGFGVRLDGGTAYTGAVITPYFDSLLVKVTAWAASAQEATQRMDRALREFRIRGVATNLLFLENVINHPQFLSGECTTRFIDDTPELFQLRERKDRATKLLRFIGEVTVNGNPEMRGREAPTGRLAAPLLPRGVDSTQPPPEGVRDVLLKLGPAGFAQWLREQPQVLMTDTTMRDAHQSLFATRMRSRDMQIIAPYYARMLPGLFSLECWGGATFDVAMRFLKEDPWQRLADLRAAVPNIPLQMLLRASNAVGYTNYPDNVVRHFVQQAAQAGVDIFRVFDSLNWVENMRVAMDAINESGGVCEATICYSGDIFDSSRPKFNLQYYVDMARQLERAGAHILGIKDMAGVCRPRAAAALVKALREETGLPVHFHTHDTSGISSASVLAAIEAGVDAVDGAMDAMSGLTSQPNLGAIATALTGAPRDPGLNLDVMQAISHYWEGVRRYYAPFEADIRSGTSDVYRHEMPGGQYTNLREQARALGIEHRWPEISRAYAEVNQLFGDIIKVTPTSKVVGDMALFMVTNDLSAADIRNPKRDISFPESVISLFRGDLGLPPEGFPAELQQRILNGQPVLNERPGASLPPADLDLVRAEVERILGAPGTEQDLASYLMYPKVFEEFAQHNREYGEMHRLSTPVFFYGLQEQDEVAVNLEKGKTLVIRLIGQAVSEEDGEHKLFFELNGQARSITVEAAGAHASRHKVQIAEDGNPRHVGAAMPGSVSSVLVEPGQNVVPGDPLVLLEAMKMETMIRAERAGTISSVYVRPGSVVQSKELLVDFED